MSSQTSHVRMHALNILHTILIKQHKAKASIEHVLNQQSWEPRDAGLLREMVYGVLRYYYSLEADVSRFIKTKPDDYTRLALLLGAYQLRYMRIPSHAAVSETVSAIKPYAPQAAGFINAVLRKVSAQEPPAKLKASQAAELPKWMYQIWRDAFGAETVQTMATYYKQTPDLCLAVFKNRETWMQEATAQGFEVRAGELSPFAVLLSPKTHVTQLPGYEAGALMVMDQAAQAATLALNLSTSNHENDAIILDLCAAPGGKTAMLAHRFPTASIVAVELNPRRIPRLQENLTRLSCPHVSLLQADCLALPYAENSVDAIMLDAPCSASGTLRRHPDAKFLHNHEDMLAASALQQLLLKEALRVLKPSGTLVYAVCSIHPAENEAVVANVEGVLNTTRLLPSAEHDGFFYAQIQKPQNKEQP